MQFLQGDVLAADTEALVNTVNCVGVMGRGIALQFKNAFPANFKAYAAACRRGEVQPGHMFVAETQRLTGPRWIINFPTKRHWRNRSRLEDIEAGLVALRREIEERSIRSIAIPPLGCGLGGLSWERVRALIQEYLADLPGVEVRIFEPFGGEQTIKGYRSRTVPRMTPGRAALVVLMNRYLSGLMDFEISLLELHKLMYFLQEAGEPLQLRYQRGRYGPYAENLRHVLQVIEGHLVSGYADGGDAPGKPLQLLPGAVDGAGAYLAKSATTRERVLRVEDLVGGFESPFGLELLSTVHAVLATNPGLDDEELRAAVYAWGEQKRKFRPRQIDLARRHLSSHGWLSN